MATFRPKHVPRELFSEQVRKQISDAYRSGAIAPGQVLVCLLDGSRLHIDDWHIRASSDLKRAGHRKLKSWLYGHRALLRTHIPRLLEVEMSSSTVRTIFAEAAKHRLPNIHGPTEMFLIALPSATFVIRTLDISWISAPNASEQGGCLVYCERAASFHEQLAKQAAIEKDLEIISAILSDKMQENPSLRDRFEPSITLEM